MKATCSTVSDLETYLYAVLSSFTKCFHIIIITATIYEVLAT